MFSKLVGEEHQQGRGGAFVSKDDIYGFMQDQAKGNLVKVAAYELKKSNGEIKYFVLPWKGNTSKSAYTYLKEVNKYVPGYSSLNVTTIILTNASGTEPSNGEKKISDDFKIRLLTIGPNGEGYSYEYGKIEKYSRED